MKQQTTERERQGFYERHQAGASYGVIAQEYGVSPECVRYWCRRQRDGGDCGNRYHRDPKGVLRGFDPVVRYAILRLKVEHPGWGPKWLRKHLERRRSVRGKKLPSEATIGRYLHQWGKFRRRRKKKVAHRERPNQARKVHQRWQIDFKTDIELKGGQVVSLHTVCDPVGEACIGAVIYPTEKVKERGGRVTMEEVKATLRRCFTKWGTYPDEIQTDGESTLVANGADAFPSPFTLWLVGLGISHKVIRSGCPTDNAEVERCHRTITNYAILGNEDKPLDDLQDELNLAVYELVYEMPSRADECGGRPPADAHPELFQSRPTYRPECELEIFDLRRVDAYLAKQQWTRKVGKKGQVCIGGHHQYYSVGRKYAQREVIIRFDPADRHFVFYAPDNSNDEIGRRPARSLTVEDLTGLATWPASLPPQQLALPFEGVTFH